MSGHVLVRAAVSADGRHVILAPGVELPIGSVDVVTDMPRPPRGLPAALLLFFPSEDDRQDFADTFNACPNIETREI